MRARWIEFRKTAGLAETIRAVLFALLTLLLASALCVVARHPAPLLGVLGGVIGAWIGSIWAQDEETYGLWFQISFQVLSAGVMGAGLLTGIVVERGWGVPVGTLVVAMMSAWSGLSAAFLSDERVRGSADDG